jgi:hypothetical protein
MRFTVFIFLVNFSFAISQNENRISLCEEYYTLIPNINESYKKSECVFTGKVTKIIRVETFKPIDYDENGRPLDYESCYDYWFVFKVLKIYKGEKKSEIKIYSRMYSGISPILELNKEYLIYTTKMEKFEMEKFEKIHPENTNLYIYCGDRSKQIENSKDEIIELEKIILLNE